MWPTLLTKFPNLVAYIVLTYGDAAPVFFKEGETLTTTLNSVGSRQGDAWAASYRFAIALYPILQIVAAEFPTVLVSAYCDKVHFTGPPADAVAAFQRYAQLTSAKLMVNPGVSQPEGYRFCHNPALSTNHATLGCALNSPSCGESNGAI